MAKAKFDKCAEPKVALGKGPLYLVENMWPLRGKLRRKMLVAKQKILYLANENSYL